jgi:hypothetical protein
MRVKFIKILNVHKRFILKFQTYNFLHEKHYLILSLDQRLILYYFFLFSILLLHVILISLSVFFPFIRFVKVTLIVSNSPLFRAEEIIGNNVSIQIMRPDRLNQSISRNHLITLVDAVFLNLIVEGLKR